MSKTIRRSITFILAVILSVSFLQVNAVSVLAASTVDVTVSVKYDQTGARSMLKYINKFRKGKDVDGQKADYWNSDDTTKTDVTGQLKSLTYDYSLEKTAMRRAAEIAISFSHTRPNGDICFTAWNGTWYNGGENIAAGSGTAYGAFVQWREDDEYYAGQGHRRNMLSGDFNRIGIGHVVYQGVHFWTQAFGYGSGSDKETTAVNKNKKVKISVLTDSISPISLTPAKKSYSLKVGSTKALPEVTMVFQLPETWPSTAKAAVDLSWKSKNKKVAIVSNGKIKATGIGTTTLYASINGKKVSVKVTVKSS